MNRAVRIIGVIAATLCVLTAATVYYFAVHLDPESIAEIEDAVGRTRMIERDWTVELVKVNANPNADFDELTSYSPAMRAEAARLQKLARRVPGLAGADRSALFGYLSQLNGKEERIERFKSRFAIVRNSERYLPQAAAATAAAFRQQGAADLATETEAKLLDLQSFLAQPDEVDLQRINLGLGALRDAASELPTSVVKQLDTFIAHASVLLQQKGPLTALFEEASSPAVGDEATRLATYFEDIRDGIAATRDRYEFIALLLLVGAGVSLAVVATAAWRRQPDLQPASAAGLTSAPVTDVHVERSIEPDSRSLDAVTGRVLLDDIAAVGAALHRQTRLLRDVSDDMTVRIEQAEASLEEAHGLTASNAGTPQMQLIEKRIEESREHVAELRTLDPRDKASRIARNASQRIQRALDAIGRTGAYSRTRDETWCSVPSCVERAIQLTDVQARSELRMDTADLPPILGVEAELTVIFTNILENAIEALGDKPVIRIKMEHHDNEIAVTVIDNGAGMDAATRDSATKMYFSTRDNARGTGLGIVSSLVRRHHGRIALNSAQGKGTAVRVTFPVDSRSTYDGAVDEG